MSDVPEILRRILENRGVSVADFERYFNPAVFDLARPEEIPGMEKAADLLLDSVLYRRKIVIFGDYDCDGVCATAILSRTLRTLGADVSEFIPDRLAEGYGMSDAALARMLRENPGVGLVVTVDTGITAVEQVSYLKSKWMSVIVTDHHLPGERLPDADALVDPKVSAPERLQNLCGAGVAFFLANALVVKARTRGRYTGPNVGGPLLVLAGLATVTDIMPLTGQNRILVSTALRRFSELAPLGLRALHDRAARTGSSQLTSKDFGFLLGPRINAAGRMASGMEALDLLLSDDPAITREAARIVDGRNVDRKAEEQKMMDDALAHVVAGAAAQVIYLPNGHPGVAGIVAARVMERIAMDTGRWTPVCVIAGGHGSARAPEGINIHEALTACSDNLSNFGGHAAAGGFSVKEGKIDAFRECLCAYCEGLRNGDAGSGVSENLGDRVFETVDAWVEPADLTMELAEWIGRMEPFGDGNREPVFAIKNVFFADFRLLGTDGRHLQVGFRDRTIPRAVWWNHGERIEDLRGKSAAPHDIAFMLGCSTYGEPHVEIRLVSVRLKTD